LLSLFLTVVTYLGFSHFVRNREQARFSGESELAFEQIEAQLHVYLTVLKGIRALFASSDNVTPGELSTYLQNLQVIDLQKDTGLEGVGVVVAVSPDQEKEHTDYMRQFYPGYKLQSVLSNRVVYPVVHVEAISTNRLGALGWDLAQDPERLEALERARDSGKPAITRKTSLHMLDGGEGHAGFIIYLPIYEPRDAGANITERREKIWGFIFGAFDPSKLWNKLLLPKEKLVDIEVYDGAVPTRENLLFDWDGTMLQNHQAPPQFTREIKADIFGRNWTFSFYSLPNIENSMQHRLPLASLLVGLIASLCLFGVVYIPARGKAIAEKLTRDLKKSETALREANFELARHIEEQKQTANTLAAEKERLAVTLRSIGDAVVTTDREAKILMMNPVAEKITGIPLSEAIGKPLNEIFPLEQCDSRQPVDQSVVSDSGTPLSTAMLRTRRGREFIVQKRTSPIRNNTGDLIGSVCVFRDTTEHRMREQELLRASKLESVGLLAGGIAHDFNNVLTAIVGNLSLIRDHPALPQEVNARLAQLEKAAYNARNLTQQLLTFAKGGSPIKQTALIAEVIRDSTEFVLRGSKLRAEFAFAPNLASVEIDTGQMSQVIQNIVINSIQACPEGGILSIFAENWRLERNNQLALAPGVYVQVRIKDTGTGIKPENLPRIFDPYFTTQKKSSGLGLATAYSIMKRHDGAITVESEWGKGATFYLYLPASRKSAIGIRPETPASVSLPSGKRILAMDDEPAIRALLTAILSHFGYLVVTVSDGAEAIRVYQQALQSGQKFDAVIMDLTIPGGIGGREAIRQLREIDPEVIGIVSSGYSNDPVLADFKAYGFAARVEKPYRIQDLEKVLGTVLNSPP
jgi:PAS domain S-box-containing protein